MKWVLLVVAVLAVFSLASASNARQLMDYSSSPRKTFNGNDVSNRWCGADANDECHWTDYVQSLFYVSAWAIAAALAILVLSILFWVFRCCLCGGCKPSEGLCCPGETFESLGIGYTAGEIVWVKGVVVTVSVIGIAFMALGIHGNVRVTNTLHDVGDMMVTYASDFLNTTNYCIDEIRKLSAEQYTDTSSIEQQLNDVYNSALDISNTVNDTKSTVETHDYTRQAVTTTVLVTTWAISGGVAVGGLIGVSVLSSIGAILGPIAILADMIMFGVDYPVGMALSDLCIELKNNPNATIPGFYTCNQADFQYLFDQAYSGLNLAVESACSEVPSYCSTTYTCYTGNGQKGSCKAVQCPNVQCNANTVTQYLSTNVTDFRQGCPLANGTVPPAMCPYNNSVVPCPNPLVPCQFYVRTIEDCALNCYNATLKNISAEIVNDIYIYEEYVDLLNNTIADLLNCTTINRKVHEIENYVCSDGETGVTEMAVSFCVGAFLTLLGTFGAILGIKRFNPINRGDSSVELKPVN